MEKKLPHPLLLNHLPKFYVAGVSVEARTAAR